MHRRIDSCGYLLVLAFSVACLFPSGCRSRIDHAKLADRDAYFLAEEKSAGKPWETGPNFNVVPSPLSRLRPPGCDVHPVLPPPTMRLYAYELPLLRPQTQGTESENSDAESASAKPVGRPIPPPAWDSLPTGCIQRMIDFDSIQREADFTSENFAPFALMSNSGDIPKLTLEDIVDQAILNSRDYQTQKESLYLTALALSQERFRFQLQFFSRGNGSGLNYNHIRTNGTTVNNLGIPSAIGVNRALATGGDFLASFANNILLTFNGPSGFSEQVSSRILIDFVQPLIQRDIQFESLTQAERNLVYAARDFARFRKTFFVRFAADYYDLIRSFRQIEIDSQNYFSLVRAFNQAEQEFLAGQVPRFQVDQVEQNLLSGRGRLIATCNSVEQSLDQLKLALGLPTETPINIDLGELNELTRLDQLSVAADSASRVVDRLETALRRPDRVELLSTAAVLVDRILNAAELRSDEGVSAEIAEYKRLRQIYLIDYSRLTSQQILADLQREITSDSPSQSVIFQRSLAHCTALLRVVDRQLDFLAMENEEAENEEVDNKEMENEATQPAGNAPDFELGPAGDDGQAQPSEQALSSEPVSNARVDQFLDLRDEYARQIDSLGEDLQSLIAEVRVQEIQSLVARASELRKTLAQLISEIDRATGLQVTLDPTADLQRIQSETRRLIEESTKTLEGASFGLKPIEISPDDAMLTALVLRFDLMNQRESLADDWRQIKLAADNLRAVLDVNASQVFVTDPNSDDPFNFSFDDSQTSLGLTFDAPLNRFTERNTFRASLINYQRAYRDLLQLEDTIKFSVRNDLRNLALDREQYLIAVASAALAYERVVSTSLEFRLGTGGVTARDFLEAQTAYIDALSNVASRHIEYIVDRTQLFLDLELLTVEEDGFWNDLRNEELQPEIYTSLPAWAFPVYGQLPCVRYSEEIRRMFCSPFGNQIPDATWNQEIPVDEEYTVPDEYTVPETPQTKPEIEPLELPPPLPGVTDASAEPLDVQTIQPVDYNPTNDLNP